MRRSLLLLLLAAPAPAQQERFPFEANDHIAWIGSSSTHIGVWPKTVEFLLRTRHPELGLTFARHTTGGGTFATGLENLELWLDQSQPSVVLFNYGGNDASAGDAGLQRFHETAAACAAKANARYARVLFTTHQAADVEKAGAEAAGKRAKYAEDFLAFGRTKGWTVYDVYHPTEQLQLRGRADDPKYTILKDGIHLTDPAYVAWGAYLYDAFNPPPCDCHAALTTEGRVTAQTRCTVTDVKRTADSLKFVRRDAVLPLLPPVELPPRQYVPLERLSPYRLTIRGLPERRYVVSCEGQVIGTADAKQLSDGVNLNALALDAKRTPPWHALAKKLWAGESLNQVGKTAWTFEVRPE